MKVNLKLIKKTRLKLGYNNDEMADFLDLTNASMYWKRENGDYKFKAEELMKLSSVLGIPMDDLFLSVEYSNLEIENCDSDEKQAM